MRSYTIGESDLSHHLFEEDGTVRKIIERVAEKWTVLIVSELATGSKRPSVLRRSLPDISEKMLVQTLRRMEQTQLVERIIHARVPPHTTYILTPKGEALAEVLLKIRSWSIEHRENFHLSCPGEPHVDVAQQIIFARIAEKWTVLILYVLARGPKRYNELRRFLGSPTKKMLTQTLRHLEQSHLLSRREFPVIPPKVEYALTPLGQSLAVLLSELCYWVEANRDLL